MIHLIQNGMVGDEAKLETSKIDGLKEYVPQLTLIYRTTIFKLLEFFRLENLNLLLKMYTQVLVFCALSSTNVSVLAALS